MLENSEKPLFSVSEGPILDRFTSKMDDSRSETVENTVSSVFGTDN